MAVKLNVKGRVALITGAGSGIGLGAAELLAQEGAIIGALGRTEDELRKVVDKINKSGGKAIALVADVSQPAEMQRAVEQLVREYGRIDFVLANAGVNGKWAPLEDLEPDDWDQTLNINLKGTFLTVKYAAPHLKKQGGSVVVVSSVNGTRMFSNTGASAYSSSKAGQVAFTKMIALELAKHRVRANVICPGAIETNIDESTEQVNTEREKEPVEFPEGEIPLTDGQPGSKEQVAQLILFLFSDMSSHITGTEIWIDGGQTLLQG
jgi:NAD(P)-dependent dehydrogenase (short-subunit alcohol dehydrogenase family)